ncbi:hypothetical protein [Chondromyces crocatus]|uniref:Molecular chaperone DnaJ n=1 Tax=Chondromyces crocatus TaxID=52 RepID=A0A0K1E7K7_CHOCO|nr:hypothetical protein [Chondromyces crocatus]AKT36844.1 molecular chaperone DnaJ [Chondromyces crocatus]
MGHEDEALRRIRENPFYVLGLRPTASRMEVEREGQKLLGMLELQLASAALYTTPVGPGERTADKVRRAMAELRDPEKRLGYELWARLAPATSGATGAAGGEMPADAEEEELLAMAAEVARAEAREDPRAPFAEALEVFGWAPRGSRR